MTIQAVSTTKWLCQRKISSSKRAHFTPTHELMQRLRREATLEGHLSCVNCIEWNQDGSLLASGSDDRSIIIWDPFKRKLRSTVNANHDGNIFSVKFMPEFCDSLIASCASDHCVKLTDVLTSRNILDCRGCHSNRVKRLAVHPGEPNLIWSSGEDGLILQYDIREAHSCRNSQSRNILVDLRSILPTLKAKCLAVNPVRSEMLAVGATDVFNRLFDRRYLKMNGKEHSCTRYFAPGHLLKSENRSNHLQSYGTTYLSFSPNGTELLASVHAEQVYLFDLLEPWERYKTFDHSLQPLLLDKPSGNINCYNDLSRKSNETKNTSWKPVHWTNLMHWHTISKISDEAKTILDLIDDKVRNLTSKHCRSMLEYINEYLKITKDCPDLYIARAWILLARGWRGDYYQAMRDCCCAIALDPLNHNIIRCLIETSTKLGHAYSVNGLIGFIELLKKHDNLSSNEFDEALGALKDFKNVALEQMITCDNNNECDVWSRNFDIVSSLLYGNDSNYMEFQDLLCVRNRRRNDTKLSQKAYDYTQRFCGHCNMNTDIKEASFFGADGDYIVSGSDDGAFYIWDKKTANLVKAVDADYQIVNCVQPHSNICMLATSGIESTVKLWSATGSANYDVDEIETRCVRNQKYISSDPLEAMILMLYPDLS